MAEKRILKVMFNKAGGNSSKNSINTRISLPKIWVDQMGINQENREVQVSFQDDKIIIEKINNKDERKNDKMTRYFENKDGIICEVPEDMYISCRKQNGVLVLKSTNGLAIKEDIVLKRLTKEEFENLDKENITTELSRFNIYKAK